MIYAHKVLLQKTFMLFSGEDSDNEHSDKINEEQTKQNATQRTNDNQRSYTSNDSKKLTDGQIKRLYAIANKKGRTGDQVQAAVKSHYKVEHLVDLTKKQYDEVVSKYEAMQNVEEGGK